MRFEQAGNRRVAVFGMTVVLLLASTGAIAQTEPEGFPDPGAPLVDPDFKVRTRQFGLDRRVEMYQWRLAEKGYERVWHGALIDSAGRPVTGQLLGGHYLE